MQVLDRSRSGREARRGWARLAVSLALTAAAVVAPRPTRAAPPCRVTVSGGFVFGSYDVLGGGALTGTATVTLRCPGALAPRIVMSKGNSSTYVPRTMTSGTDTLAYNIYLDPGFTKVWGDLTEATYDWEPGKSNATTTAYGLVPAGQDPSAGSYSDAIVITLYP